MTPPKHVINVAVNSLCYVSLWRLLCFPFVCDMPLSSVGRIATPDHGTTLNFPRHGVWSSWPAQSPPDSGKDQLLCSCSLGVERQAIVALVT